MLVVSDTEQPQAACCRVDSTYVWHLVAELQAVVELDSVWV